MRNKMNRRNFLKTGAAAGMAFGAAGFARAADSLDPKSFERSEGTAKNVVFLVSDGMSMGTLTAADHLLRRRDGRPSAWMRLYEENRARRSLMDVAPLNALVTDSAASASAWGCGHRVVNGSVNMDPDGNPHTPILPLFKAAGRATGLVTTTELTHATPAGFAANVTGRGMANDIADQYYERGFDLMLGGGSRHFEPEGRRDDRDHFAGFADKGYHVLRNRDELMALAKDGKPLFGTFASGHLPYTLDQLHTPELMKNVPTLAEMTRVALERLSAHPDGFILQVEGGRVDHAAHSNDLGGLVYDQIAFDDAIQAVLDFQEAHPDTLVIITTDHGNANPGLNGTGHQYAEADRNFDRIQEFRHTNTWILGELDRRSSQDEIRERIEAATGIGITEFEAELLESSLRNRYRAPYAMMTPPRPLLGQILANYTSVNWMGTVHTGDYVELAALGPGSETLANFTRNTDLFHLMTRACGVPDKA